MPDLDPRLQLALSAVALAAVLMALLSVRPSPEALADAGQAVEQPVNHAVVQAGP
jgi:hypothetical protein